MLQALNSGHWRSLPTDEQVFWLGRLKQILVGRDSIAEALLYDNDGALKEASDLVAAQKRALERGL